MSEINNVGKRHYIADESLGGIEREYTEVDRKAEVGDFVKVTLDSPIHFDKNKLYDVIELDADEPGDITVINNKNFEHILSTKFYRIYEITNIVRISGERYEMVDRRAEVGEKIILMKSEECPDAVGKVGEVYEIPYSHGHDLCVDIPSAEYVDYTFVDDDSDKYVVLSPLSNDNSTGYLANERGDIERLTDMLASLSQEVAQLKRKVSELSDDTDRNAKDIRTWADDYTQNKAEVADLTEMLTDDICTLDDRTQPLTTEGVSKLSEELTQVVTEAIDAHLARREAEAFLRRMGGR